MLSINAKQQPLIRNELAPFSPLDMDSLHTPVDFEEDCRVTKTIHKNDRSTTVLIKNINTSGYSIAKIYDCYASNGKKIKQKVKRYWNQYQIVKYSGLNEYFRLFYDPITYKLTIHQQCYQQTLSSFISTNGPIRNENEVKPIMYDILMKLWQFHQYDHVHCHIKPSNIMERKLDDLYQTEFISDGWLLIDFDSMQRNERKNNYKGSVGWSAPEIDYDSKKNVYRWSSDVFSFGLIILYIMTGSQPLQMPSERDEGEDEHKDDNDAFPDTQDIMRKKLLKEEKTRNWYYKHVLKSENLIKNALVKLYYENKISLNLFELLHDGLLIFDPDKRWNCKQIYDSKWFSDIDKNT